MSIEITVYRIALKNESLWLRKRCLKKYLTIFCFLSFILFLSGISNNWRLNKFCKLVSEVSFFVSNPVWHRNISELGGKPNFAWSLTCKPTHLRILRLSKVPQSKFTTNRSRGSRLDRKYKQTDRQKILHINKFEPGLLFLSLAHYSPSP